MKTYAYSELYLPLIQRILGDMYDYAVNQLGYSLKKFHEMFIVSGIAHQFEICNPTYSAGMNGCEVAREVINRCGLSCLTYEDIMQVDKSQEYWIGWALSFYQWHSAMSFQDIQYSVDIEEMYNMYPTFHEMSIEAFVDAMDNRTIEYVSLRQIQLFEQGQRDINKTQGETLRKLAKALNCSMEDLMQDNDST